MWPMLTTPPSPHASCQSGEILSDTRSHHNGDVSGCSWLSRHSHQSDPLREALTLGISVHRQSTIGISVWIFGIAAALSLPKQLILVYLGVLFGKSKDLPLNSSESVLRAGHESARTRTIVSWAVLLITGWMVSPCRAGPFKSLSQHGLQHTDPCPRPHRQTVMAVYIIWYYIWLMRKEEAAKQAQAIHTATISSSGASILEDDKHPGDAFVREGVSTPSSQYSSLPFYFASVDGHEADNPSSASLPSYEQGGKKGASAVTTRSRSGTGRSRSGTLASLAFSNNSLPYLPYTPMVELPSNIQMAPSRLPSPMPAAMMASSPPDGAQAAEEIEMLPATESDGSSTARLRRIRLARSNSDLSLSVVEARGEDYDSLGQLGPSKANLSVTSTTTVTASARPRSRQRSSTLSISTLPPDLNAEGGVTEEK